MDHFELSNFPEDTYFFIRANTRYSLFDKLKNRFGSLRAAGEHLAIPGAELYSWKNGFSNKERQHKKRVKRYIPLPALDKISKATGVSLKELQRSVIEIKTGSRSGLIKNLTLPLEIKPETYAVLGHFLGDGYGGERGNSCYVNKSPEAIENFVKKLRLAFGNVEYTVLPQHYRVIVSKIVPKILKQYFEISDFRTGKAKLSSKLLKAPNECLVEFLKALIIDEGSVMDSGIYLEFSSRAHLINDLKKICSKLGYQYSDGKHFIISVKSFPRIIKDMKNLVIPSKQQALLSYFKRKGRGWYNRNRNTTKKEILHLLTKNPMSVREIALRLNIRKGSVRMQLKGYSLNNRPIKGLLDLGLVEPKAKGWRNSTIFGLKTNACGFECLKCL